MKPLFLHSNQIPQGFSRMAQQFYEKVLGYPQIRTLLLTLICFGATQLIYAQEDDGVVSLSLPVRNSLTFNRYLINPTFSFVREQNKYISAYNKREWVQFDDAPQTYLLGYSGRFAENIGAGIGLFQQDYGVLTTYGGVVNFAYNAQLTSENNLTFGLNLGVYKSGLNTGKVITNFSDPSLNNIPSHLLLTANPGINYGTTFLDFGVSINNLVLYNLQSSELIKDDPRQSIQAHVMYTGYMHGRGFFEQAKFSGLLKSEIGKESTIVSGILMMTSPKGIWAQVGFNSLYGGSAGLGLNITEQIAIEYNFEKALGDMTNFGPSHDITLAFKFKNNSNYKYHDDDEMGTIFKSDSKRVLASSQPKIDPETRAQLAEESKNRRDSIRQRAQAKAETRAQIAADEQKRSDSIAKARTEALALAAQERKAAQDKVRAEAQAKAAEKIKLAAEAKAKADQEAKDKFPALERANALAKAKADQEAKDKLAAQQKAAADAKAKADADAKLAAAAKAKADQEAKDRLAAQQKAAADANAKLAEPTTQQIEAVKNPTDAIGISMKSVADLTEASKNTQNELLAQFNEVVASKNKDLQDLKQENDLSEQGIYSAPKPFKSISDENAKLATIKTDLDNIIKTNNDRIKELDKLYNDRLKVATLRNDEVTLYYQKALETLKAEQLNAIKTRTDLTTTLERINEATEVERKRRIKRATYTSEEGRYMQDRATLKMIKERTSLSPVPLKAEDFDFGEKQGSNIQIVKNVEHVENGYYVVVAVHTDVAKRDEFLTKAIAAGQTNVDFFYDVNTSKYFIYYKKVDGVAAAMEALKTKGSQPYNDQMSIIKIEN
ncbi:MAG TPA: PorP/SprF family type IX secretion system membrane protein [Gelidibacter sp.]|uniref:PorP/SprF family type IX secretion system membrane protein n=1 Tax=Gelidibacter sp. TaxID=2018083 RepID=UPI002CE91645|nr:PorP/SprF family type IX secretion system membrane protein [Gelidibacter sp.]HXJ99599.1 PorP/SprF family type IX secretion system membrane protein [Gelidibacter sp.]